MLTWKTDEKVGNFIFYSWSMKVLFINLHFYTIFNKNNPYFVKLHLSTLAYGKS